MVHAISDHMADQSWKSVSNGFIHWLKFGGNNGLAEVQALDSDA
jgi:hypothetical protein